MRVPQVTHGSTLPWLVAGGTGLVGAVAIIVWLERALAPGAGWVWLALTAALGGAAVALLRRIRGQGLSCALGPRLRPLQVSGLALQALGALLFHYGQDPAFQAALPPLAAPWLSLACVLGGLLVLGLVSITSDCRDAELHGRV
ncbi:MAG: hypothetical protein RMK84_10990 [Oscillochloridaceae bacterium]|nr:hypothetical protein [Chloroflexaceae bacterium]MDW8390639.1 hypothetical protein [Oscillochloridaceae bacterium]